MLRIKAIAPLALTGAEVVRRQDRYARLGGDRIQVELVNLTGAGAPTRLDSAADITLSDHLVRAESARTDPQRFDLVLPDCVLDPGVDETLATPAQAGADTGTPVRTGADTATPVPVVGILRLAAAHLAALGRPFAAVTRNAAIATELRRRLAGYGLAGCLTSAHVLDIDFCFVSDDSGWSAALTPLASDLAASGVSTLLNGCSAVDLPDNRLSGVLVVDPTDLALRVLAAADGAGLYRSPWHTTPAAGAWR